MNERKLSEPRDVPTGFAANKRASLNHWLIVVCLTLIGIMLGDSDLFQRLSDRTYLGLQHVRHAQKRVIVVAIDDDDFYRGPFAQAKPLNRKELAGLVTIVANADPDVIGLDVGLETPAPRDVIEDPPYLQPTIILLTAIEAAGKQCSVVLAKSISGGFPPYHTKHDVYDACGFDPAASVTPGHTSAPLDERQIPTRVGLTDGSLDSFALAIARAHTMIFLTTMRTRARHGHSRSSFAHGPLLQRMRRLQHQDY